MSKIDWDRLQHMAAGLGRPVSTLVAQSATTDPFYLGEARMRDAQWFAGLYHEHGFGAGVHIRRIHYRLVSQEEPVLMPGGAPYENTTRCSKFLNDASRDARYAGLVEIGDFIDRKNPDPQLFLAEPDEAPAIGIDETEESDPVEVEMTAPRVNVTVTEGFSDLPDSLPEVSGLCLSAPCPYPYHVEIWCEKSTMNDILVPLARRGQVNLQTATGEMSLTRCRELVERAGARPIRLIYISDFDPGGESMPLAAARKIEWLVQETGLDIQLHPILLTKEQCREYRLPRTPIKETESRAARFEERHGEGATELDALEALLPGTFAEIVQGAIDLFRSQDYIDAWQEAHDAAEEAINETEDMIRRRHAAARMALDDHLEDLRSRADDRLANLRRAARERAEAIQRLIEEHLPPASDENMNALAGEAEDIVSEAEGLTRQITDELENEAPDADGFDWPEPDEGFENPLFDSTRDYVEQIDRYKEHQDKPTAARERVLTWKVHTCAVCGEPFQANRGRSKYCSPLCYERGNSKTRAAGRRANRREQRLAEFGDRKCAMCGGKIETLNPAAKYCSPKCNQRAKAARRPAGARDVTSLWCTGEGLIFSGYVNMANWRVYY